jgi:ABC-type phosphate/phosphonate transport system ATPase subunit
MNASFLPNLGMDVGSVPCDLRAKGVTKHYEGFTLDGVSLEVPRGSIVGLIGQNGTGKTTLMKAILGTIRTDAGSVELFGRDMAGLSDAELVSLRNRVGFVSAVTAYPDVMTVSEVATMYRMTFSLQFIACMLINVGPVRDALLALLGWLEKTSDALGSPAPLIALAVIGAAALYGASMLVSERLYEMRDF